jgi:hypothetical protein
MFKSLAVAALLGSVQAQGKKPERSDDEKRGIEMMKGFFIGSSTVDLPPKKGEELENCANYLDHVVTYGDNAYNNFKNF